MVAGWGLPPLRYAQGSALRKYDAVRVAHVSDESSTSSLGEPAGTESGDSLDDLDGSALSDAQEAIADARRRLAEVPADVVVTNHVMGLYELAAIHLSNAEPDLTSASLAIDAMAALVDGLGDRLGAETPTMRAALSNIQMVFVQMKSRAAAE